MSRKPPHVSDCRPGTEEAAMPEKCTVLLADVKDVIFSTFNAVSVFIIVFNFYITN